jgi:oligosaccharide 4-alpha-D-glucosyltransferase
MQSILKSIVTYILLISVCLNITAAQSDKPVSGKWKIYQYPHSIIKIVYEPVNYKTNENISDAVILKPQKTITTPFETIGDSISVGKNKKVKVTYSDGNDGYRGFKIQLNDQDKIYGGGERALPLNRRGFAFGLYNNPWYGYSNGADNLNFSVPFFSISSGYGIFFDNASQGKADLGKSDPNKMTVTFSSGELNIFIIFGKDQKDILRKYHQLTGVQPLPPRWSLGCFMSRFGYQSEKQVTEIAASMKKEKIPFDAVIIDLFWFGDKIKGTMGNLDWVNRDAWPDPEKMIRQLKEQKIKSILITEPFILKSSLNYSNSIPYQTVDSIGNPFVLTDFYFGDGGLIDIFRKDAQQWFWEKHDAQNKKGIAAWWGDLGEPEKHPKNLYHNLTDLGHKRLFRADEVHNIYGHYWTKMLYENYADKYPDTRLFSLNRSGFAGSQRYNIIPWSGDVSRSWSGLQAQLPLMLGMSMSGIPYIHSDAGGFAGGESDYELYIRWLQFSAFTPIFRPHGTALFDLDPQAYSFPSEPALMPEPYKSIAKNIVISRYKLLPYNYTLAYSQSIDGSPLVHPLYFQYPENELVNTIEDQYMWGDNILIAPIVNKGQTERKVILPDKIWYRYTEKQNADVGLIGTITESVPLEESLVYVKEGSFIPTVEKSGATSEDFSTDSLTIHYYYSKKKSNYTLFDDNGISKNSLKSENFELIHFDATPKRDKLLLKLSSNQGMYTGKPTKRYLKFILHGVSKANKVHIMVNGKQTTKNIKQDKSFVTIFDSTAQNISIE